MLKEMLFMQNTNDLRVSEMLKLSQELWEKHKNTWSPLEPEYGKDSILYMIEEVGEVISIIKKKGEKDIMNDVAVRERFVEELGDVLMYYMDTLNKFKISSNEFSSVYLKKFQANMRRDYKKQYEDFI
jgi:NTP pyrophosphatase (non-canonical NTP hydrolase)